jgi:polysaccharide export outer membrane protein
MAPIRLFQNPYYWRGAIAVMCLCWGVGPASWAQAQSSPSGDFILTPQSDPLPELRQTIQMGDRLLIRVLSEPALNSDSVVLSDGTVELPRLGALTVLGLTPAAAAGQITNAYQLLGLTDERVTVQIDRQERDPAPLTTPFFAPPPPVQPRPNLTVPPEQSYTLGAGDRIQIQTFQLPQYSGDHEVLIDGTILLPQLGAFRVTGLTPTAAAAAIAARYEQARILRNPQINLILVEPRPFQVAIAGEISRPGSYVLPRQGTQFPTLSQALQAAGGITQAADLHTVEIRRTATNETLTVNLWQLLQTGNLGDDPTLRDGDTIVIRTATTTNLAELSRLRDANFAASTDRPLNIAVIGEVFRPGPYTVTGGARTGAAGTPGGASGPSSVPTVARALQVAGGIKPQADIRRIQLFRRTGSGDRQTLTVNLWELLQSGNALQDVQLQEGDTLIVPKAENLTPEETAAIASASFSPDSIRVNVVGEVQRPGLTQVSPNASLNQTLLAAGGFSNRARRGTVVLVRLNPDGTVLRQVIPIDFAEDVNTATNPPLRNEDILIVSRSGLASFSDTLTEVTRPLGSILNLFLFPLRVFDVFNDIGN